MIGTMNCDQQARLIADRQYGVITRRQALALGMTDRMMRRRVTSGLWTRIEPGTFQLSGQASGLMRLLSAATLALPAVVSHESAAELHGLPHVPRGRAVVTVPIRSANRFPGVQVHQSTDLAGDFIVMVEGLPTTSLARTVVDLAAVLRAGRLERIVDHCLVTRAVGLETLSETVARLARRGKPGTKALREILETRGPGLEISESILELELVRLLTEAGLPAPVQQHPLPWRPVGAGRADLAYPDLRLLIEADGRRWHALDQAFDSDRRRDNLAMLAGWRVLRFTWRDLVERPADVVTMVSEGLAFSMQK
jgi:hypothetical protein